MKVIGVVDGSHHNDQYICQVSRTELEKFLNLYYSRDEKMQRLKAGDVVDLGKGHDFAREIVSAMQQTQKFVESHQGVITAILNGLNIQQLVKAAAAQAGEDVTPP